MKEHPILFKGEMIRAIIAGQKSQTRRAMRNQVVSPGIVQLARPGYCEIVNEHGVQIPGFHCPYGQPGDQLWVREAWSVEMLSAYGTKDGYHSNYALRYKADLSEREIEVLPGEPDPYIKLYENQRFDWRPSIHMPRLASRITLEITGVRVERLQDINEEDAKAEGVERTVTGDGWRRYSDDPEQESAGLTPCASAINSYQSLWSAINGDDSWNANPWVWVVEFKRVQP
jgi:hypothetical protein